MGKVLVINFSSRDNGNCKVIANYVKDLFSESVVYNFSDLDFTRCGHCGYECFRTATCPKEDGLSCLNKELLDSNKIVFVVPNYCGFPCSNYFIFNERTCGLFAGRRDLLQKYLEIDKDFLVISNSNFNMLKEAMSYQVSNKENVKCLFISSRNYANNSLGLWSYDEKVKTDIQEYFK